MYHRRIPRHDIEGFPNLLDHILFTKMWEKYGINVLELEQLSDFPSTTDRAGWSTDPNSDDFPFTYAKAHILDRINEKENKMVDDFLEKFGGFR